MAKPVSIAPHQWSLFDSSQPEDEAKPARATLWAALYFNRLSLEVLRADLTTKPWVVVSEVRAQQVVHAASDVAMAAGVEEGMRLSAAYALCPRLQTEFRDEDAERDCLIRLAEWAGQYTSLVSLEPQALLLDIVGSLQLFGGLDAMRARMQQDLQQQAYAVSLAIAPTPQAALLLARCGEPVAVDDADALRAALGKLPIVAIPVNDRQPALFTKLGLRHLRDVWRLPREGLARRFGRDLVDYLARLLGETPEPRLGYRSPPQFSTQWSFPMETDNTVFILHGAQQLLPGLIQFMRLRHLAINQLHVVLYHQQHPPTRLSLGMRQLCSDAERLFDLMRERINQTHLLASVTALALEANTFHAVIPGDMALFPGDDASNADHPHWQHFIDQMQLRLGAEAVHKLQVLDDHRPERSWRYGEPAQLTEAARDNRPLWLLPQPQWLKNSVADLQLCSEPERIEGGWWDGNDVRRDYYQARDGHGRRLWVFRDLQNDDWYLHGFFA